MTSRPDELAAVVDALRRHPRQAMTSTELAARSGVPEVAACTDELRAQGLVRTHDVPMGDPHLPDISAVALVGEGPEADRDAEDRARTCAAVLERQLLRSHRCQ